MRRAGSVALGLLLLAAVLFVTRAAPAQEQRMGNIVTSGSLGETIDTRGFKIRVERVRLAKQVVPAESSSEEPVETKGVWVAITATIIGDWKATTYDNTRLRTPDGRIYRGSDRMGFANLLTEDSDTQPGIPRRGVILFEVPPSAVEGAVLHVAKGQVNDSRLGPEAAVDLGLDPATARKLIAEASPRLAIPESGLGR